MSTSQEKASGSVRRIVLAATSTVSGLLLVFSYHTSTTGSTAAAGGTATPGIGPATGSTATPAPTASSGSTSPGPSATTAATPRTYTGDSVDTRWGPVQVQVTVVAGKITDATAAVYPQGNQRDVEINSYALPVLHDEVLSAQSSDIDMVSGATVTSEGYQQSLQDALDQANL